MTDQPNNSPRAEAKPRSQCTSWFAEGEALRVIVGEAEVLVRYQGRKGRKARISITAPAGAQFEEAPPSVSSDRN